MPAPGGGRCCDPGRHAHPAHAGRHRGGYRPGGRPGGQLPIVDGVRGPTGRRGGDGSAGGPARAVGGRARRRSVRFTELHSRLPPGAVGRGDGTAGQPDRRGGPDASRAGRMAPFAAECGHSGGRGYGADAAGSHHPSGRHRQNGRGSVRRANRGRGGYRRRLAGGHRRARPAWCGRVAALDLAHRDRGRLRGGGAAWDL